MITPAINLPIGHKKGILTGKRSAPRSPGLFGREKNDRVMCVFWHSFFG
jgi:hypothetical protein